MILGEYSKYNERTYEPSLNITTCRSVFIEFYIARATFYRQTMIVKSCFVFPYKVPLNFFFPFLSQKKNIFFLNDPL